MSLTPEQRERLDALRLAAQIGRQPTREPDEVPVHLRHAHFGTDRGRDPCACPPDCTYCCECVIATEALKEPE